MPCWPKARSRPNQRKLIYTRFWAPLNLNTATLDDIMLNRAMMRPDGR
jgi:hypothetical protein